MTGMVEISSNLLYASFILYLVATFLFSGAIRDKRGREKNPGVNRWGKLGITAAVIGFATQVGYFITRWIAAGHAPVSNLFEFTTFFGMMLVGAFLILYAIYRLNVLGLFALPIALLLIAYASMFPKEVSPLIPALKSDWLHIHVTTVAAGQAILSISFVAGLIYLLKSVDPAVKDKRSFWLETIMYSIVATLAFILLTTAFSLSHYKAEFNWIDKNDQPAEVTYQLPPLVGPHQGELLTEDRMSPLVSMPGIVNAKQLNTVIWTVIAGTILYVLIRLLTRKRVSALLRPLVSKVNLELVDEIGYRSVLIGFPVFTLGGLIFAMIWAQIAWTRFWGWDPKEVWALITFLFYAAFLHLRLSRGWHGERSAWLAVIGLAIIIFNLVFVNLIIAGLHSYA